LESEIRYLGEREASCRFVAMTATVSERLRVFALPPLARHASFFDRNADGKVKLGETYAGLRALGVGIVLSSLLAPLINVALGLRTGGSLMVIDVGGIARGKHAFETGSFGAGGVVDDGEFAVLFAKAAGGRDVITRGNPDRAKVDEPPALLRFFAFAEASVFFCVAGVPNDKGERVISRARLHRFYAGHLLYAVERRNRLLNKLGKPIKVALGKTR
jgi:peroxygenase